MKNGKIGFGLVGTGMAGAIHAREMAYVNGGELVAACSRDLNKLQHFATEFRVPRTYTDHKALIADDSVDVVVVLVPTGLHMEVAIAASEAGKHVIIEKPLEINLQRADEIIRVPAEPDKTRCHFPNAVRLRRPVIKTRRRLRGFRTCISG